MAGLITSSLSGLMSSQIGLATAEHNISNAATPGFTRQEVQLSSRPGQNLGGGFVGQGVSVSGVKRIYDQFLNTQVLQEQTQSSYLSTYHSVMKQIDNMVADPTAGVSPALQEFFSALNGVANNPESIPARQTFLNAAQFVTNRFQAVDQRLTDISNGLNGQITGSINTINTLAQQIASLNGNIKRATGASLNQQLPNDLLDQRDQLITQLNKEIKVSVLTQSDGTIVVSIGSGQTLVIDELANKLQAVQSSSDPSKLEVAYKNGNVTIPMQQTSLQGGNLGAYLAFRDESLEPARNALGRVALGLASSLNEQNQLGLDLQGLAGNAIFRMGTPRIGENANNSGTATLTAAIGDVGALTTSDYELRYDGVAYKMFRLSDNAVTNLGALAPPASFSVDGVNFNLTAGASAGDSYLIRPTADAARDLRVTLTNPAGVAAALPMRTMATLTNTGDGIISSGTLNLNPVSITFGAGAPPTTFTVTDTATGVPLVTNVPYVSGSDISYNGWTVQLTGAAPVAGDTFTLTKDINSNNMLLGTASTNTGNVAISGGALDLQQPFSITFNTPPTTFRLSFTNASIAADIPSGTPLTVGPTSVVTLASTSMLTVGDPVSGGGFPDGSTILSITNGTTFVVQMPVGGATNPPAPVVGQTLQIGNYPYTSGGDISYNGWTVQISGAPVAGDIFNVAINTNATGDNRNGLLMAGIQLRSMMEGGTATLQETYGQLVGVIGAKTHELDVTSLAQANMTAQTIAAQQSVSGVNLDEEAANLMRYQKAYQASAKAMQISQTMFDALLGIGG